jgi:hypothetical protein
MPTKFTEGEKKPDEIQEKIAKAYERKKKRAHDRENKRKHGNATWKPKVYNKVLVRTQPSSDAIAGVTRKFIRPYEGPYIISKVIPPSTVEVCDRNGKFKGQFNLKNLRFIKKQMI